MKTLLFAILLVLGFTVQTIAQDSMTEAQQRAVIDSLCASLNANYVFPETAKKISTQLQASLKAGDFKQLTNPGDFGNDITRRIQDICHDKHLRVRFAPQMAAELEEQQNRPEGEREVPEAWMNEMKRDNFGFKEVKILPGNIGYLDLRGFNPANIAGETAAAAMTLLSNSDALIIDLRENGGGDPGMIQLITTYLYDEHQEPVHLNSFYFRPDDITTQTWTLPYVAGKRLGSKAPVYILTSNYTFSAAEEFTYNLKNLKRATIVGETTGGGAHPGGPVPVGEGFVAFVPIGRAINPITKTNWEGTGVAPDIATTKKEAFDKAYALALDDLSSKAKEETDRVYYQWQKSSIEAAAHPPVLSAKELEQFTGQFGERRIFLENGKLYYQRGNGVQHELVAMTKDTFRPATMTDFRLRFEMAGGKVVAVTGLYEDGRMERNEKNPRP
jgi:hypothetical protein